MDTTWSRRRKLHYVFTALIVLSVALFGGWYFFLKNPPTCFDGRRNGDETGTDCGGSCRLLCTRDNIPPLISWTRIFEVSAGMYNAFALIENPNMESLVRRAPYTFTIYDEQNTVLLEKKGITSIPPGQKFAILEPGIQLDKRPGKILFSFGSLAFERGERSLLRASDIRFTSTNPPRVDSTITNRSLASLGPVEVAAIVYGGDGNALGVSKTIIDEISGEGAKSASFTWQKPFTVREEVCEIPTDTLLLIDRSGSMDDDGINPPQPLTAVLEAAQKYIQVIGSESRVGLITFATDATNPIDQPLTASSTEIIQKIDQVRISTDGLQHTNAHSALERAFQVFDDAATDGRQKIVVLLTDGVVTRPRNPINPLDDIYPENQTVLMASKLKNAGVHIYTIGLGNMVNDAFLTTVASQPEDYFKAPTSDTVGGIYTTIARTVCKEAPVIEILPRVLIK